MGKQRNQYNAEFKFQVALEAAKGNKTVSQVASEYGVHPTQVSEWKAQLMLEGAEVFNRTPGRPPGRAAREVAKTETELYEQIGRLKMELEWLKKKVVGVGSS
jgi:transposase-like protein